MAQKRQRPVIGLLINQIEGRYQSLIRRGLSDFARDKDLSLLLFVGRSLSSPYDAENRHNTIYSLARSGRLDGLIITTGSIGNYLSPEGIASFLATFAPVPIITIGSAIPGVPAIVPDNTTGISGLVHHLVQEHQYRRIAFLGGPQNNPDAQSRKNEFIQAMRDNDRVVRDELLYPGDFSYRSSQLLANGIDVAHGLPFDAVVAANDDMALGFLHTMETRGFTAPRDFAITGFDDVPDARFLSPPLTTVHQPLYEQGVLAGERILAMIEKKEVPAISAQEGNLIIRDSCGCSETPLIRTKFFPAGTETVADQTLSIGSKTIILSEIARNITLPAYRLEQINVAMTALFDAILLDLRMFRDRPLFIMTLNEWFNISVQWDDFSEVWHLLLSRFHMGLLGTVSDLRSRAYLEDLFQGAFALLTRKAGRRAARELASLRGVLGNFRDFSWRLGATASLDEVMSFIKENVPSIGFTHAEACLHKNGPQLLPESEATPFYADMSHPLASGQFLDFPAEDILPPELARSENRFELVIMPLTGKELSFGYICLGGEMLDPLVYDTLRDMISQALSNLDYFRKIQKTESELHSVLEKLKASEERYREMAKAVPMIVIETDTSLNVRYSNQAGQNTLGFGETEHISLRRFLPEDDVPLAEDLLGRIGKIKVLDYPGIRFIDRKTRRFVPVVQVSGIFREGDESLTGLRWNALAPLPFISGTILPDKSFFTERKITGREQEVVSYLLQGLRIKDIAERLFIAESTVKGHLTQIYDKLGISSRNELIHMLQEEQVGRYGFSAYLFSLVNKLLSLDEE